MFASLLSGPKTLIIAAGALGLLLLSASARADLAEIRKSGKIRVVVSDGAPLFFSVNPGRDPGLECEILKGFCQLKGLTLTMVRASSPAAAIQTLLRGGGDIAAGGIPANGTADIQFSTEILPSRLVVVTRKPALPVQKLEELHDLRVGTLRGALFETVKGAGVAASQVDDVVASDALFAALKAGKVGACIMGVEYALPAKAADPDLQIGMYVGDKLSLALALRKDAPQLHDALNEYVGNLRRTATWNRLVLKYFGDSAIEILKASR